MAGGGGGLGEYVHAHTPGGIQGASILRQLPRAHKITADEHA